MGLPQIIFIVLLFIGLTVSACLHGKPRKNYHFGDRLLDTIITLILLLWGGFFK